MRFVKLLAVASIAILFSSCKHEVTTDKAGLCAGPGATQVIVTLNGGSGETQILYSPEWLTVSAQANSLVCVFSNNEEPSVREDVLVVKNNGAIVSLPVVQGTNPTFLKVSTSSVRFSKAGGTQNVFVCTNGGDIQMEALEGVDVAFTGNIIAITAAPNDGGRIKGDIKLTCGKFKQTVHVWVDGICCPTCKGEGYVTCPKCKGQGYYWEEKGEAIGNWGCEVCGGRGYSYRAPGPDYRKGTGKVACTACGGNGVGRNK